MTTTKRLSFGDLAHSAGRDLGASRWVPIDQDRIDAFADTTEDHQWIHVDPDRATAGPFGAPIAHGYLTISLVGTLLGELVAFDDSLTAVNYGLDRLRFPSPVLVGSRLRATATVLTVTPVGDALQLHLTVTGEIENQAKPACAAVAVLRISQ